MSAATIAPLIEGHEIVALPVVAGALAAVPIWHDNDGHGRAWLAAITGNATVRAGLGRRWCGRAQSPYYYTIDNLKAGDAIEFGADQLVRGGKIPNRWYGVVRRIDSDAIHIEHCAHAKEAMDTRKLLGPPDPSRAEMLEALYRQVLALKIDGDIGENRIDTARRIRQHTRMDISGEEIAELLTLAQMIAELG